ncbi:MAG: T9SS type A sorting domain-containing protein, partial [Bacteroidales bacterium]|nr:T9SS type A sorting domain-containing protein [Bacteroidales bacterium]
ENIWVGTGNGLSMFDGSGGDTIIVSSIITDIKENVLSESNDVSVYPNPFNFESNICFEVNSPEYTIINIYTLTGKLVHSIVEGKLDTGVNIFKIGTDIIKSPGIYILSIKRQSEDQMIKLIRY